MPKSSFYSQAVNTNHAMQKLAYGELMERYPDLVDALEQDIRRGLSVQDIMYTVWQNTQDRFLRSKLEACTNYLFTLYEQENKE